MALHPQGRLTPEFFLRDTVTAARELLGTYLVRIQDGFPLVGRISETEAYIGRRDRACHAYGYRPHPHGPRPSSPRRARCTSI